MARSPKAGSSRAAEPEPEPELAPPLARLAALLDGKPEALAAGDEDIREASLAAAKFVFDRSLKTESAAERHIVPFLASLQPSAAPKTRSQTRAEAAGKGKGKQKASEPELPAWNATPLDALYVDGAEDEQVWAQLDLRAGALCAMLGHILEEEPDDDDDESGGPRKVVDEDAMDEDEDGLDVGDDAMLDTLGASSDDDDSESEPGSSELDALLSSDSSDGEHSEHEQDLRDPSDDDSESESEVDLDAKGTGKSKAGRKSVLDDGFFSLADFNAEADAAEARSRSSGRLADDSDDSEEDEDVDIFADVDAPGDFDEDDLESSGELYYKDFFDPPSRKALAAASPSKKNAKAKKKKKGFQFDNVNDDDAPQPERKRTVQFHDKVRVKPIKPSPLRRRNLLLEKLMKEQGYTPGLAGLDDDDDSDEEEEGGGEGMDWDAEGSTTEEDELADGDEDEEDKGRAAIERLKDDLFADDDDVSGPADMSTHEKRMAELQAQIAALEAENVAPRAWTLMGEAAARSRPQNALLEEDLEFDRAARPVPAVTEEKVAGIEDLIRRRILENNFDDVERKRPENELAPSRRAQFEISDQKSQKSLAQLYEDEYSAAASGTATVDDRDGKLAKEHKELEKLWDGICYKLDALCNAHFTPKAPTAKITTIANVPAASLESALPTATAAAAMLAPEEVAARATARALVAKSEMTPEEKRRVRAREKERRRKRDSVVAAQGKVAQISSGGKPGRGSVKKEKEKALSAVTKGRGVTVVGKANGRDAKGKGHAKGKAPAPADGKKLKL